MSRPGSIDRQALRKQRLVDAETEQSKEDAEALRMTEDERRTLLTSFASVKTQFFDLDGLCWSRSALKKRAHTQPVSMKPSHAAPDNPLSPLTNTISTQKPDSENWEDTVRPGGDITTFLAAYHASHDKHLPNTTTVSRTQSEGNQPTTSPRYISYTQPLSVNKDIASEDPFLAEPPTPRPGSRVVFAEWTTTAASLKRRAPSDDDSPSVRIEAKRAHTLSLTTSRIAT